MTPRLLSLSLALVLAAPALPAWAQADRSQSPKKRQRVVSDLSGFELLDEAKLKSKPVVAGATRGGLFSPKPPVALAPYLARVYSAEPVFLWASESPRFAFVLIDASGAEVHRATVDGTRYAWPARAPKLQPGRTYAWSVTPEGGDEASAAVEVLVADAAVRAKVDKALSAAAGADAYAKAVARARVFTDNRLWYDAVAAWAEAIALDPKRPEAWEGRGNVFAQIPATRSLSDQDFARADELSARR